MHKLVTVHCSPREFREMFEDAGIHCFSKDALAELYYYLEKREDELGYTYIIKPVALSKQWAEYESFEQYIALTKASYASLEELSRHCDIIMVDDEGFLMSMRRVFGVVEPIPFDETDYWSTD